MQSDRQTPLLAVEPTGDASRSGGRGGPCRLCARCACFTCAGFLLLLAASFCQWWLTRSACALKPPLPPTSSWHFANDGLAVQMEEKRRTGKANVTGIPNEVDVVVIGAGYAGLTLAQELMKAGKQVLILEAHDHAGGRTVNLNLSSYLSRPGAGYAELGGQWIGPRHYAPHAWSVIIDEMNGQVADWGYFPFPGDTFAYTTSEPEGIRLGLSLRGLWGAAKLVWLSWPSFIRALVVIFNIARMQGAERPYDQKSFETWLCENVGDPGTRSFLSAFVTASESAEPSDWSMEAIATIITKKFLSDVDKLSQYRIVGGTGEIARRLSARLGDVVRLSVPVTHIAQDGAGVTVTAAPVGYTKALEVRAKYAVMTGSPFATSKIAYNPPLPAPKQGILGHIEMGSALKMSVVYDHPWWRDNGLSGSFFSATEVSVDGLSILFPGCLDSSPIGVPGSVGILLCFCAGRCSHDLYELPEARRREVMTLYLAKTLGPQALTPLSLVEYNWMQDPYTGGAYQWTAPPGTFTDFDLGSLYESFGRVMWAGADYRPMNLDREFGFIEGAIAGGRETAKVLLEEL